MSAENQTTNLPSPDDVAGVLRPEPYNVAAEVAATRASVGNIVEEARFCVSEIGILRREDLEIALAAELLRVRAALAGLVALHDADTQDDDGDAWGPALAEAREALAE
jgi:hypothetical protein